MKRITIVVVLLCLSVAALAAPVTARAAATESSKTFACIISQDFFAGLNGDKAAMDRAMKICDDALAKDPKNADAMVWQGAGWVYLSGAEFQHGRIAEGQALWSRGLDRMDEAVSLAPRSPSVLITRGMALLSCSLYERQPEKAKSMVEKGVLDLETALKTPGIGFDTWPVGARGRILIALADGYDRLGRTADAQACYKRIVDELKGTEYATQAQSHLQK